MLTNEKEYNGNLFDQLSILERIEAVTDDEKALKQIAIERRQIERKPYQSPPLVLPFTGLFPAGCSLYSSWAFLHVICRTSSSVIPLI